MKGLLFILFTTLLFSTICYSQTYEKHIYKKWVGGSGVTYLENNSSIPIINKIDSNKVKQCVKSLCDKLQMGMLMWTYPDHKYYSGYYIKGTFDIEIYTNRTAISVAYYINKGETLSKEQEQEIRESQIQLTELIIRELKLL